MVSPNLNFNFESRGYFIPRLIMVDFFVSKQNIHLFFWYFFKQLDRKILWNFLSAVRTILCGFNNFNTGPNNAFCSVKLLAPIYSNPLGVATNKKVNKTFKTLTYSLFPVPCSLKSSGIFATNKIGLLYDWLLRFYLNFYSGDI